MSDRQSIVQALIEGALRAGSDPEVTTVLRGWDYYRPGTSAQPLAPFLVVGVTDDVPYGIGIPLYRCAVNIMICVSESPAIRDTLSRIRGSVRSVMESVPGLAAYGVHIDGAIEAACTEPDRITESGDLIDAQTLTFNLWFESPPAPAVVLDPEIFLVDKSEPGVTYVTRQAQDPRRIERWTGPVNALQVAYAFGAWSDRAALKYSVPITPLSTEIPPDLPITPSASAS